NCCSIRCAGALPSLPAMFRYAIWRMGSTEMLLLVDAGNTRIKWALADAGTVEPLAQWKSAGSVVHGQIDSLAASWSTLDITRVLLSNVAGAAVRASLEAMLVARGLKPEWQTAQAELAGIRNGYRQPTQLGSDRFYSAIGA